MDQEDMSLNNPFIVNKEQFNCSNHSLCTEATNPEDTAPSLSIPNRHTATHNGNSAGHTNKQTNSPFAKVESH